MHYLLTLIISLLLQGGQSTIVRHGATLPATCTANQNIFIKDGVGPYFCSATNTWTLVGSGSSTTAPTVYNVVAYGATGNGTTDDSAAIAAAGAACNNAGGGVLSLPPGTYIVSTQTLYSKCRFIGSGYEATSLVLKSGTNSDLLKSSNFDTLTGTDSQNGIHSWSLENITLDGNKAGNASGWCMRVYGYNFTLRDVRVRNCKSGGIYSEWSTYAGIPGPNSMEAFVSNVHVWNSEGEAGIKWAGPHDSIFNGINSYVNIGKNIWIARSPMGLESSNGMLITNSHTYGPGANYGFYIEGQTLLANDEAEGGSGYTSLVMIGYPFSRIIGGTYFGFAGEATKCFQIGDGTHSISSVFIDVMARTCEGGAFNFDGSAGYNTVRAQIIQTTGALVAGTPLSTDLIEVMQTGETFVNAPVSRALAVSGIETVHKWQVQDDQYSNLKITNHASSDGSFAPEIRGQYNGTVFPGLTFVGDTVIAASDSGAEPITVFDSRSGDGTVSIRPLFDFRNNGSSKLSMDASGMLHLTGIAFSNLGTPANGSWTWCTDCTIANPCAAMGPGAFAKRQNSTWVCN